MQSPCLDPPVTRDRVGADGSALVALQRMEAILEQSGLCLSGLLIADLAEQDLAALLMATRNIQRRLDGLVMQIAERSNQLAADGRSAPAEEAVRGGGAVGARQARREAARAQTAAVFPGLQEAVSSGATSGEHVDAINRHTTKLSDEQRARLDLGPIVDAAKRMPVESFARLIKRRADAARADHGLAESEAKRAASEFRHWFDEQTGLGRFSGALDPERYEVLVNAIDLRTSALAAEVGEPKTKQLSVQALVDLITADPAEGRSRPGARPSVIVVVDHDTVVHGGHQRSVRQTENGHELPPETIARLCCDATIRRVTMDRAGVPLHVGRRYRTATDGQWAAVKAMHSSCAWDGCPAPISWCQLHHIKEWEHGGRTDLPNLIPLCGRHHHRVHEGRWSVHLAADRTLQIIRPDGTTHSTVPPPRRC